MNAKTVFNIVCILSAGLIGGYVLRARSSVTDGEVVYTDDGVSVRDGVVVVDRKAEPIEAEPERVPEGETWVSEFELVERSGEKVSSADLIGTPYIVSFFFSTCPSICVQQNQKIRELQEEFAGRNVKFLAISVDPETDTPERLREYAARFGADQSQWLFLTGSLAYIRHIGETVFDQPVDKKFHTERFVLVDPRGHIEGFYGWPNRRHFKRLKAKIGEMIESTSGAADRTTQTESTT